MTPHLSDAEGHLGRLKALLAILAIQIDDCDNKTALASLSRQYTQVLERIVELEGGDVEDEVSDVDTAIAAVVNLR